MKSGIILFLFGFNLTSQGFINNLGFKIYILF